MVEVILLSILILLSLFAMNKNVIETKASVDYFIKSYKDSEEENLKIRKLNASVLQKLSETL